MNRRTFSIAITACVGERLQQLDLDFGEVPGRAPAHGDRPDRSSLSQHRHADQAPHAQRDRDVLVLELRILVDIRGLDDDAVENSPHCKQAPIRPAGEPAPEARHQLVGDVVGTGEMEQTPPRSERCSRRVLHSIGPRSWRSCRTRAARRWVSSRSRAGSPPSPSAAPAPRSARGSGPRAPGTAGRSRRRSRPDPPACASGSPEPRRKGRRVARDNEGSDTPALAQHRHIQLGSHAACSRRPREGS